MDPATIRSKCIFSVHRLPGRARTLMKTEKPTHLRQRLPGIPVERLEHAALRPAPNRQRAGALAATSDGRRISCHVHMLLRGEIERFGCVFVSYAQRPHYTAGSWPICHTKAVVPWRQESTTPLVLARGKPLFLGGGGVVTLLGQLCNGGTEGLLTNAVTARQVTIAFLGDGHGSICYIHTHSTHACVHLSPL